MSKTAMVLQWSLRAGAVYFSAIALAHTFGIKLPGLYIYFNIPSQPYQDHIIAFLAFGWAAFYFAAAIEVAANPRVVKFVLVASVVAIVGMARINLVDELVRLAPGVRLQDFWLQTLLLALYVVWLTVLYLRVRR